MALINVQRTSPLSQTAIVSIVFFCCVGLTSAVSGLGAGGSHPRNIPVVDRINALLCACMVLSGLVSGSFINKLGPRVCLVFAATGYPIYTGGLWWLDSGRTAGFSYFCGALHGITAGLFYSTATYIVSCYSTEQVRGAYVSSVWVAFALGSAIGSATVLAITIHSGVSKSHVPPAVYITVIVIQSFGVLVACLLSDPSTVRRNDDRAVAYFANHSWIEELRCIFRESLALKTLVPSMAFAVCQVPNGFFGSVNAFYFNARTRALNNVGYWSTTAIGSLVAGLSCDSYRLGYRRQRGILVGAVVILIISGIWSGILFLLIKHDLNRHGSPPHVDWTDRPLSTSVSPLIILTLSGLVPGSITAYAQWLASSYSNNPVVLARLMGYVEALRGLGQAIMYALDSHKVAYRTEGILLFSCLMCGAVSCVVAVAIYPSNTEYGSDNAVVIPEVIGCHRSIFELNQSDKVRQEAVSEDSEKNPANYGVISEKAVGNVEEL
ncbi:hypothetical protein PV08_05363 [Exophiala spinifera]|uniref:Major facilitator superfamily (MFS) profile domain-containing protein n=1 Tax=Exophiala spinifera TaxID=91928 RepID=A0A0D2B8Q2_9EURO|nr:uncharacterized protein PV08_05363 [Exophiala spinifera]KIW15318.1 hypothetical protein PV08_05363 [Exophiala spinifera]